MTQVGYDDSLFKTHDMSFDSELDFNRALSLKPKCVDIGYSSRVLCFETNEELQWFRTFFNNYEWV